MMQKKTVHKDTARNCPYCGSRRTTLMFYDQMQLKGDALNTGQWPADCSCGGKWIVEEDDKSIRQIYDETWKPVETK